MLQCASTNADTGVRREIHTTMFAFFRKHRNANTSIAHLAWLDAL